MKEKRLIGRHTGQEKGPLLICFGGMHGNEPAGIQALSILFKLLELEPESNPDFRFRGRIVGLKGNLRAIENGVRFLDRDLNRQWCPEQVKRILNTPVRQLRHEALEILELHTAVMEEIQDYQPDEVIVLDLHTTTAYGGIFSIATDDPKSVNIAVELHAPVITGLLEGIQGTTLHYFNTENIGIETTTVCFESGQHEETLSVNRAIAAIINCMRTVGCVRSEDVENRHDALLIEYARGLPKVSELITTHSIRPGDQFRMVPDYKNFQKVKQGEILAFDRNGPIEAIEDGLILMPLYQKQGEDGFFLIRAVSQAVFQ
ncbi:succinylglutamate desuccinylase/aspartoacylase family protein [Phaeodactylibacter sp.]|uniref:succinylglutamate desuccinylase/aspartoacylase family protein n=1 Tax=Phaeodactylibacter sp. TaxID=1940289 RepID=UPI0025F3698F|nr:succinylglutamate desuccinylase/aspartoacylase family protein [Phaeodactylibacter sp.]MCI4648639.1 succinylglutamate desuccinylase/aspartoacylase family protein [Phaeodactylibacter sp.]MCI5091220.1 succinylglutamate desuccinylase/aspartoacylase family protein [Phaeodactylibacter sp.]